MASERSHPEESLLVIREMTAADIEFAVACTHEAGWQSEGPDIFDFFLRHDPRGCFVAEVDGRKGGICVATGYERHGFIGELVVTRDMRLLGLGRRLFGRALAYLQARGFENVYLDGDLNAVPFYEEMGFKKICRSLRFRGRIPGKKGSCVRRVRPADMDALCEMDKNFFGDERDFFLRLQMSRYPQLGFVLEGSPLGGYIMARPGDGLLAVGPWAVEGGAASAAALLEHLSLDTGEPLLRIGVLENNVRALSLLRSFSGLEETSFSWFMGRGPSSRLGNHPGLYAIGSGAKG